MPIYVSRILFYIYIDMLLFLATYGRKDMKNIVIWRWKNSIPQLNQSFLRILNLHYLST